ncbi:pyridoxal phosphate-dependent aminotransferase [Leptospira sp. 201903071]|uniref:pyridoxal phosphate-dependent aminotransferase n=1 Tax=Leptospira ainazelensis TaxID=2810034 RepID=UPI001966BD00|nr:pyridoxal phosphate-dependent aminotransferase [Leptospira ainazelensis]MBM9501959.1 pyridoxal phosphate-dependent aminotransferase [Leptospira ainazelensis]
MKPSASIELDKKANLLRKSGRDIISLGIGDPHFPPPKLILDSLHHLPDQHSHYSDSFGLEALRTKIATNYEGFGKENILITPGVKQGLYYLLEILKPRRLCILEPAWLGYAGLADYLKIPFFPINLRREGWLEDLKRENFDCLILCSPNNPDGRIFSKEEMSELIHIVESKNAFLIADEIYLHFSYMKSLSFSNYAKKKESKIFILNGFSKSYAVTGYRVGYIVSADTDKLRLAELSQQNLATCTSTLSQYALLNFDQCADSILDYFQYYLENRNLVAKELYLNEEARPNGGFYYFLNLGLWGVEDSEKFCSDILYSHGLVLIPGSSYGSGFDSFVRLSFCIDRNVLVDGLFRLKNALKIGDSK